jgi:hypothetical protein
VAERYPKSTPGFERDGHVTLTIVVHPRVRQQLQYLQEKKMGESPYGNSELSSTRTHDQQLHHPEHLPNELRLVPGWFYFGAMLRIMHVGLLGQVTSSGP